VYDLSYASYTVPAPMAERKVQEWNWKGGKGVVNGREEKGKELGREGAGKGKEYDTIR